MTEGRWALSGPGTQTVYMNVYRESQNWAGNFSTFRVIVVYEGNGYGSWTNALQGWSANCAGIGFGGQFTIPSPGTGSITLLNTTFNVGHDAAGYMGGFTSSVWIDTNHSSIGDGGGSIGEGAAPRIPKRPSPPGQPTFSEITPTSVRVSWAASADNGGAGIDAYLLRRRGASPSDGPGYVDSFEGNTSRVVGGLTPGATYWFGVYAHNGAVDNGGFSNKSIDGAITLPAGFYVGKAGAFPPAPTSIGKAGAFIVPEIRVGKGGSFVPLG